MIDLSETSGLPLELDETASRLAVRLGGLQPGELEERALSDLRDALADTNADGPDPAYYMYRDVARLTARDSEGQYNWRYDITVFPAGRYGDEYLRTVGHYHPLIEGTQVAYPEVYEVLHGSALFILQRADKYRAGPEDVSIDEIILLHAEAGEKAMMLPGYGHWTVNTTDEPVVVSNWICGDFESHYDSVIEARGPCCHVQPGPEGLRFERNRLYRHPPDELRHARPVDAPELGLVAGRPIFRELHRHPGRWRYLCDPTTAAVDLRSALEITRADPLPR